ncbi:uncharacterized protein LOC135815450 [Sycon ciliatum]|uniref:uncharacterized protein LOC135815450 n=1 Tax=Sycon ciliatum TaxID=27933 RepID=UPI0031F6CE5C
MVEDTSIIDTLRTKLEAGKPFVNCGPVLITLNPYQDTDAYDGPVSSFYHVERECGPNNVLAARSHVFSVARIMRQLLLLHNGVQVAVFMGFSGSGKSYAADTLIRQAIRPYPIARSKPFSLNPAETAPLGDRVTKAIALIRKAITAGGCQNSTSTRGILEIGLRFQLPSAGSENRAGNLVGATFAIYGLERWRVALRRPTSSQDSPFFMLNEVIAALVCTGFSNEAQRVIENSWRSEEREFLTNLARAMLGNEKPSAVREWGRSFEATVHSLFGFGMANIQIAHLFRALSAVLLLTNIDFNTTGGINPLYLSASSMVRGADWRQTCTHAQWPDDLGAGIKCTLGDGAVPDADAVIEAEMARRPKAKQLMKKATRSKADGGHGMQAAPERGLFSNSLAYTLPLFSHMGINEDMLHVAAVQGGYKGLASEADLRGKLLDRLVMCGDRSWISPNGSQVNATIIDFVADLLELESADLYASLTQPTQKEKTVNVGTVQLRCDALASSLYAGTVNTMVDAINLHFECNTKNTNIMYVIDTPGFEDTEGAHFSQLYRNLTAELFNSFYVSKTFTMFEKHCRDMNIDWTPVDYTKVSTQVLDTFFGMLHKRESVKETIESANLTSAPASRYEYSKEVLAGLLGLQQQEIWSSDEDSRAWDMWNALMKNKEKNIIKKDKKLHRDAEFACKRFFVNHYSGKVQYSVETWVDTNRCVMPPSLIEVVGTSSSSLVRRVAENAAGKSLLGEFQEFERTLLAKLGSTQNHFIQCIRPNNSRKPNVFDTDLVATQVKAMQLGPLGKTYGLGFHYYYGVADFIQKYKDLIVGAIPPNASDADICRLIVDCTGVADASRVTKGVLINHRARGKLVEALMKNYRQVPTSSANRATPSAPRSGAPPVVPRPVNSLSSSSQSSAPADDEDMYIDATEINPRGNRSEDAPAPVRAPSRPPAHTEVAAEEDDMYLDVSQIQKPTDQDQRDEDPVDHSSSSDAYLTFDDVNQDMYLDLSEVHAQESSPQPIRSVSAPPANKLPPARQTPSMPADDGDMYLDLSEVNAATSMQASSSAPTPAGIKLPQPGQAAAADDDLYLDLQDMQAAAPTVVQTPPNKLAERTKSDTSHRVSGAQELAKLPGANHALQMRRNTDAASVSRVPPPRLPPKVGGPPPALPPTGPADVRLGRPGRSMSDDMTPRNPRYPSDSVVPPALPGASGPPMPAKPTEAWYHGVMERNEAVQRLKVFGGDCFLVRGSTTREGSYTLSFVHQGQVNHFKISVMKNGSVRMPGNKEQFDSLAELVEYHQRTPLSKDGKLLHQPCIKR